MPVLLILLVSVVEVCDGGFEAMRVQNAAEAGALFVAKHGWNSAGISAAVVNATGVSGITANPAPTQFRGCPAANGITSRDCTLTYSDGTAASSFVQISATLAHATILTYPGLALPTTRTGRAIVRVN